MDDFPDTFRRELQGWFTQGLVTIVGSGMSCACGLPSMADLADALCQQIPARASGNDLKTWEKIDSALKSGGSLESTLGQITVDSSLLHLIVAITADVIGKKEIPALLTQANGELPPLSRLILLVATPGLRSVIITTNYDRLIEFAAERALVGIDVGFHGQYWGTYDHAISRDMFWTGKQSSKRNLIRKQYRPHISLHKVHGSVDWYDSLGKPIRSCVPLDLPRLMVTPGCSKYRKGYDLPFDGIRDRANTEIDQATHYLILGYGFHDDHLETHLRKQIEEGKRCLVMARTLSKNALEIVQANANVIALERTVSAGEEGTRIWRGPNETILKSMALWNLDTFLKEIYE